MKSREQREKEAEYVTEFLKEWYKIPLQHVNPWNYTNWIDSELHDMHDFQDTGCYENAYGKFRSRTAMEEAEMNARGYG